MNGRQERARLHSVPGSSWEERLSDELVALHAPLDAASEAYRMLRTNLFYALIDFPPKVIVVTSPGPGEGKSTTCANLGITLAQAGKSVLILDCDLRKPAQHRLFGLPNSPGLMEVLSGERGLRGSWRTRVDRLEVVSAGHTPPNPSEILGSQRFADLVLRARQEFDYVLLDTSPVCAVSDSSIAAKHGDGVLLVVDFRSTSKRPLKRAVSMLENVGADVIGTVVNRVRVAANDGEYGYVYPYYGAR
jgi:capsular exopolysaccharide synthesis family protein